MRVLKQKTDGQDARVINHNQSATSFGSFSRAFLRWQPLLWNQDLLIPDGPRLADSFTLSDDSFEIQFLICRRSTRNPNRPSKLRAHREMQRSIGNSHAPVSLSRAVAAV